MTEAEIDRIVRKAAKCTVEEVFLTLGIDVKEPLEVQQDFAWLRNRRFLENKIRTRAFITMSVIVTGAIVAAVWATVSGQGR